MAWQSSVLGVVVGGETWNQMGALTGSKICSQCLVSLFPPTLSSIQRNPCFGWEMAGSEAYCNRLGRLKKKKET